MVSDVALSIVFVACQLALLAIVGSVLFPQRYKGANRNCSATGIKRILSGVAAGVVIVTGVVDITPAALQQQREDKIRARELVNQAQLGKPLLVRFNSQSCLKWDLGSIACDTDYKAQYDMRARRWVVTGYNKSSNAIITGSTQNSEAAGSLSIWGALFRFDNAGNVYRFDQVAGSISIDSVLDGQTVKP